MSFRTLVRDALKDFINWLDNTKMEKYDTKMEKYDVKPVANVKGWAAKSAGKSSSPEDFGDNHRGVNFTIYGASGGKIVSVRTLDERTDRWTTSLYIITDKEDLGEELAQIITREGLTR